MVEVGEEVEVLVGVRVEGVWGGGVEEAFALEGRDQGLDGDRAARWRLWGGGWLDQMDATECC